jgi:hypothetical protein
VKIVLSYDTFTGSTVPKQSCLSATAPEKNVLAVANPLQRASFFRKWTAVLFLRSQSSPPDSDSLYLLLRSRANQIASKDAFGRI